MNKNIAFSGGYCSRLLMMYINCATVRSEGTKNLVLSISAMDDLGAFSTITGIRPGFLALRSADSAIRSSVKVQMNIHVMVEDRETKRSYK